MVPDPNRNVYSMQLVINLRGSERVKARVLAMLAQARRMSVCALILWGVETCRGAG